MQIIPAEWVDDSTKQDTTTDPAPFYQYFWWVNTQVEGNHFYATGKHGQYIYIVPEQNLIFVRFGRSASLHGNFKDVFRMLAAQLAQADG